MPKVDVTLIASGASVNEPWISRICNDFRVEVNIKKATVDTDYGWMHLELVGPVEEIQRAIAWLMTTGLHVESEQRAVGA
jgi:ABC-type methionine transport system ATPase subunit